MTLWASFHANSKHQLSPGQTDQWGQVGVATTSPQNLIAQLRFTTFTIFVSFSIRKRHSRHLKSKASLLKNQNRRIAVSCAERKWDLLVRA